LETDTANIPGIAMAAYQRAAVVIGAADPSCGLDWALLAAIGQVESDHGQFGDSHLDVNGVARPPIIGLRLDGRHGTSRIDDTDAGRLDGDREFDRAVGPMQFLPSTWAAVAVDGDGDGRRDVEDIDDASLGSAVYLCADQDDLSTKAGQRKALLRYNHSRTYADRVLAIAQGLRDSSVFKTGDVTVRSVADLPRVRLLEPGGHRRGGDGPDPSEPHFSATVEPVPSASVEPMPSDSPSPAPTPTPTPTPTDPPSDPPTDPPSDPPTDSPSDPPTDSPSDPPTDSPSDPPTDPPSDPPTEAPVLTDPLPPELADLTPDQVDAYNSAWATCDDDLVPDWSADPDAVEALTGCLAEQLDVPADDATLLTFVDWLADNEGGGTG
jgi:hypothetical protein